MKNYLTKISWSKALIFLLVIFALWLPRGLNLDRFATADENLWLVRSANFLEALANGNFADTFQKGHPGVTVTWVGSVSYLIGFPTYLDLEMGQRGKPQKFIRLLERYGHEPMLMLEASRKVVVAINVFVLALAYLSAIRLVGFFPATIGFLIIAFDPFATALSRLLHADGLLGPVMLLALLEILNYFYRGRHFADLAFSAIAAGFSWLTKSPAFFLIPFFGLLAILELRKLRSPGLNPSAKEVVKILKPVAIWFGVAALIFVAFWPSMWVHPFWTLKMVFDQALNYAAEGHASALFFAGQVYPSSITDWRFYPVNYLWRITPPVLIGLGMAVTAFIFRRRLDFPENHQRAIFGLVLFAVLFAAFMTLGGKKFDRYLLPVFAPLDLVAALGWYTIVQNVFRSEISGGFSRLRSKPAAWLAWAAVILGVIFVQLTTVLQTQPYYFTYYNSLLGGIHKASKVMMVGWGEGLDLAARYLNSKPNASELVVQGWYEDIFSYNFVGKTVQKDFTADPGELEKADYYVLYVNQWQRQLPSPTFLRFFDQFEPEYIVRINGTDYARIYHLDKLSAGS